MKSGRKIAVALLIVLVLLALGAVGMSIASRSEPDLGLADGRLQPCPGTPNCVSSEVGDASIEPLRFAGEPAAAFASLLSFLDAEPRTERRGTTDSYAHYVFTTKLMRYRDDLELRLDAEAKAIHVRSASRVGQSDLGANRARVDSIRERWQPPSE